MSDNNTSLVPDVIKSASDAVQANFPETAKQTDGAISTVVGFFNSVVLYPVKKANITFKYKLEQFENDLRKKTASIPDENLQVPPVMIAGPTLEALRYAYDEEELREMYENLLASAMDNRKSSQAHPAFVDAIKQMNPLDAKVLSILAEGKQFRCVEIKFAFPESGKVYMHGMPTHFVVELADLDNPYQVSASITNLNRLGLIRIGDYALNNNDYEAIKEHPYVQERKKYFELFGEKFEIEMIRRAIQLDDYGEQFAKICLEKRA